MSATWTHTRGGWAIEIRISHAMSAEDLANALLWDYRYHDFASEPVELGVGRIRDIVRERLRAAGIDTIAGWPEHIHERHWGAARAWAGRMITAAYGAPPADGGRR